jgi:hypothetical protein
MWVYAFILLLGGMQLALLQREDFPTADSSCYVGLANSLVNEHSYEFNYARHALYPPGYPMTLALISILLGSKYTVFLSANVIFGVIGLMVCYQLLREEQGREIAAMATVLFASSPYYFEMTTRRVFSDVPFFMSSMLVLYLTRKLEHVTSSAAKFLVWWLLLFFAAYSIMLRSVGVAMLAGLLAWILVSRVRNETINLRFKLLVPILAIGIMIQALWMEWTRKISQEVPRGATLTYIDQWRARDPHRPELGEANLGNYCLRAITNLVSQSAHFTELLLRMRYVAQVPYSPLVVIPFALILLGVLNSVAGPTAKYAEWYFISYIAIYLMWPFDEGNRFILPVFPLACGYFCTGLAQLAKISHRRPARIYSWVLLVSLGCLLISVWARSHSVAPTGLQERLSPVFWLLVLFPVFLLHKFDKGFNWPKRLLGGPDWMVRMREEEHTLARVSTLTRRLLVGILLFFGFIGQVRSGLANLRPNSSSVEHRQSYEAAKWIESNTRHGETVMAQQAAIIHQLSGRKVVGFLLVSNPDQILRRIRDSNVKFLVVVDPPGTPYFLPSEVDRLRAVVDVCPGCLEIVQRRSGYRIFRVVKANLERYKPA